MLGILFFEPEGRPDEHTEEVQSVMKEAEETGQDSANVRARFQQFREETGRLPEAGAEETGGDVSSAVARQCSRVDTGPASPDRVPDRIVDAAGEGNEAVVLAWMDAAGGQVDATFESGDTGGFTLLMYAVANGQEKLVDLLLGRGAKVNQQASNGMTALMHAVLSNRPPIVRRLLGLGADLKARAANGKTALQFAKEKGFDGCVAAFRQHIERVTSNLRERGSGGVIEGGSKEAAAEGAATASEGGNSGLTSDAEDIDVIEALATSMAAVDEGLLEDDGCWIRLSAPQDGKLALMKANAKPDDVYVPLPWAAFKSGDLKRPSWGEDPPDLKKHVSTAACSFMFRLDGENVSVEALEDPGMTMEQRQRIETLTFPEACCKSSGGIDHQRLTPLSLELLRKLWRATGTRGPSHESGDRRTLLLQSGWRNASGFATI